MSPPAVVIPIKAFERAKMRLAPALDPRSRQALARALAAGVIAAAAPLDVWVVCDDTGVRRFAEEHGAGVIWAPDTDLNGAVTVAVRTLAEAGAARVAVAHADLPEPASLVSVISAADTGVVLVPDRDQHGTNVIVVPTGAGFRFAYGPESFTRHRAEAARCGLPVTVIGDADLAFDLDHPTDLPPEIATGISPDTYADSSAVIAADIAADTSAGPSPRHSPGRSAGRCPQESGTAP